MKHYDLWISKAKCANAYQRWCKRLNPIPLIEGKHDFDFDIDVQRVPKDWYEKLVSLAMKRAQRAGCYKNPDIPVGVTKASIEKCGFILQEVKR